MFWTKWLRGRDRREHIRRHASPLTLTIEGTTYRTVDWSLGGFAIHGFHRALHIGEKLAGTVLPAQSREAGKFAARVQNLQGNIAGLMITDFSSAAFLGMGGFTGR